MIERTNKFVAVLTSMLFVLAGCTTLPNYKEGGEEKVGVLNFKYGKYCGKGHPDFKSSQPGTEERTKDLLSIWPPVDDIDLICYAHDLCYQGSTQQNLICDQAFSGVALTNASAFRQNKKCENLQNLVAIALGIKFFGTEEKLGGASFISAANMISTVPLSLFAYATKVKDFQKHDFPKNEGKCFYNSDSKLNVRHIISEFEYIYREYAKGYKKYSGQSPKDSFLSIPIPIKSWRSTFRTYEIQKYLNYYGYTAGYPDGEYGDKTRQAILEFQKEHSMQQDRKPTDQVLDKLKLKFLDRPKEERFQLYRLSYEQKLQRYGY